MLFYSSWFAADVLGLTSATIGFAPLAGAFGMSLGMSAAFALGFLGGECFPARSTRFCARSISSAWSSDSAARMLARSASF